MPTIDRTITLPGRAEEVFAYLSDFTTTEEWDPPTQSTVLVSGDGGVGTRYRNISKFLGKETETVYTVVALEAPTRLELEGDASSMRLHDTLTVEQAGADVRVTYRAEFHPRAPPSWRRRCCRLPSRHSVTRPRSRWRSACGDCPERLSRACSRRSGH